MNIGKSVWMFVYESHSNVDERNATLFQIKVFSRKIKETAFKKVFRKLTSRRRFT